MSNQIKADWYKLVHSKLFYVIIGLYGIVLLLYIVLDLSFVGDRILYIGTALGTQSKPFPTFLINGYLNPSHPQFWELLRSSMSSNFFIWIIPVIFLVSYFMKEYTAGTIKLSVAYGISRFRIYLSKLFISIFFLGILYFLVFFLSFTFTVIQNRYFPSLGNWFELIQLILWNDLVMIVFVVFCFTISLLVKNTGIASAVLCVFMFVETIMLAIVRSSLDSLSCIVQIIVKICPLYYWMDISGYYLSHGITADIIRYGTIGIPVLLALSLLKLRRQEIK